RWVARVVVGGPGGVAVGERVGEGRRPARGVAREPQRRAPADPGDLAAVGPDRADRVGGGVGAGEGAPRIAREHLRRAGAEARLDEGLVLLLGEVGEALREGPSFVVVGAVDDRDATE